MPRLTRCTLLLGETNAYDQTAFNFPDRAAVDGRRLVFTDDGTPPNRAIELTVAAQPGSAPLLEVRAQ